ncbi:hypothetical protein EHZ86_06100 [Aeromonas australiensis]|nr:hypothetical protein [Aeromonas australiensis]
MLTSALHHAAGWAKSVFSSAAQGAPRRSAHLVNIAAQLAKYSGVVAEQGNANQGRSRVKRAPPRGDSSTRIWPP